MAESTAVHESGVHDGGAFAVELVGITKRFPGVVANDDKFTAGTTTYDLSKDGVGYATSGGQVDDIKTQLEDAKAKIISGEITVPTK